MSRLRTWLRACPWTGVVIGYAVVVLLFRGFGTSNAVNGALGLLPGVPAIGWVTRRPMPFAARKRAYGRGLAVVVAAWCIPSLAISSLWSLAAGPSIVRFVGAMSFFTVLFLGIVFVTHCMALVVALGVARWAGEDSEGGDTDAA